MKTFAIALSFITIAATAAWAQDDNMRVIVGFSGAPDDALERHGGNTLKKIQGLNAVAGTLPIGKVDQVRSLANVSYVEPDLICSLVQQQPHAKGKPSGGGTQTPPPQPTPESTPWGVTRIHGPVLKGVNWSDVVVGVVDTGIDLTHPDLAGNIRGSINFVDPSKSANDDNGHGSHVAGTIAGVDNEIGVIGVAPNVGIYAAKGLNAQGSGYSSDLTLCIQDCVAHGVKVISMSWGSSGNSTLIQAALEDAAAGQVKNTDNTITQYVPEGIVLVAASGNDGNFQPIIYPAAHLFVLAIGATGAGTSDIDNPLASFTNTQPSGGKTELDLVAPGVSIPSTYKAGGYATLSGTSMATPHVSAVAALVRSKDSALDKAAVENVLKSSSIKYDVTITAGLGRRKISQTLHLNLVDALSATQ